MSTGGGGNTELWRIRKWSARKRSQSLKVGRRNQRAAKCCGKLQNLEEGAWEGQELLSDAKTSETCSCFLWWVGLGKGADRSVQSAV